MTKDYTDISGLQANAVLAKGIDAHAESEALSPAIITDLRTYLSDNYSEHNYVIFSSSGESCVACASKENIVAQELVAGGLLKLGHFIVTYGATYEDTAEIAGFNDLPYLLDFQKGYGRGSIPIIDGTQYEMLEGVKRSFELSARSNIRMASVLTSDNIGFSGVDAKDISSLETAEARALRHACEDQKKRGLDTPWDLQEAVLYTMLPQGQVGSLVMSEALWCNIGKIVTYWRDDFNGLSYQESTSRSNVDCFHHCAKRPYDTSSTSFVRTFHLPAAFENKAQHAWRHNIQWKRG